jgi:hypothetical protein
MNTADKDALLIQICRFGRNTFGWATGERHIEGVDEQEQDSYQSHEPENATSVSAQSVEAV